MNLEQWSVGGRGFGSVFIFLLMAGEIYTCFTFLGASGWAYGKGAPIYYVLANGPLAYAFSYFLLPLIWKYAKENAILSQPDFFSKRYNSKSLGILVAMVGAMATIPFLILQLRGLGIIVSEASYGQIPSGLAISIGAITVTIYVIISGIHGSAWTAVLKDILILVVVIFIGLYFPLHYYGGIENMFEQVEIKKPGFLTLPTEGFNTTWFISTIFLTASGYFMWPHTFSAIFSAENENVFKKNATFMPLYSLILIFVFFVGFTAFLQIPNLKGAEVDLALFHLAKKSFDPWIVGIIGGAGFLAALVPASMILLATSTSLTTAIYKTIKPNATTKQVGLCAKCLVPIISLIALYFTFSGGETIGALLLMGYSIVSQLLPALLLGFMKRDTFSKQGIASGIIAGIIFVAYFTLNNVKVADAIPYLPTFFNDINIGLIGILVNILVLLIVNTILNFRIKKEIVLGKTKKYYKNHL